MGNFSNNFVHCSVFQKLLLAEGQIDDYSVYIPTLKVRGWLYIQESSYMCYKNTFCLMSAGQYVNLDNLLA